MVGMPFICSMFVTPHSSITAANLNILDVDIAEVYFQFVICKNHNFSKKDHIMKSSMARTTTIFL